MGRFLFLLFFTLPIWAAEIHQQQDFITLGDTAVSLSRYCSSDSNTVLLFHPHDNETTAKQIGLNSLSFYPACLLALEHSGNRRISFTVSDGMASFDPNRIYTATGRWHSLLESGNTSTTAIETTTHFAEQVLNSIQSATWIIALHNNTDDATNIESYLLHPLAGDNAPVFINPQHDEDDYFYVNDAAAFAFFKARGFNVVQQTANVKDDGSLSVYAAQNGIRYINIEAQYGHSQEQAEMLEAAFAYIQTSSMKTGDTNIHLLNQ